MTLQERLRAAIQDSDGLVPIEADDLREAADRIDQLEKALKPFVQFYSVQNFDDLTYGSSVAEFIASNGIRYSIILGMLRQAVAALAQPAAKEEPKA